MDVPVTAKAALLQVLLDGPGYGFELADRISKRTNGAITLLQGSLYPALHSMEKEGLVASFEAQQPEERGGGKRLRSHYKLTADGKKLANQQRTVILGLAGTVTDDAKVEKPKKRGKKPRKDDASTETSA